MTFALQFTESASQTFQKLEEQAKKHYKMRKQKGIKKSSKQEGLFKQIKKSIDLLRENPRHPSLNTHEFSSIPHPWNPQDKVFEAYVQNKTPGAYRIFWCYGPQTYQITVIAITPHP